MTEPYVLTFEPILKEKVWGGRRLANLGKHLPAGAIVGESWEIADLGSTSAGGGGGGEARSVIANGPLAGKTLHDAIGLWGPSLLGDVPLSAAGGFPLLVKYLDAREHLSVQVHPSPEYAATHPGAHLKTECWSVLDAAPGSVIFKGVRRGVTRADFERALRAGQGEGVVELLEAVPAVVGECHNLPSGTVHALGAGVLVAEVQTPSDTTFRVYDWATEYGRAGRELHVEAALACIDFAPATPAQRAGADAGMRLETDYFSVAEIRPGEHFECTPDRPAIAMVLAGECECHRGRDAVRRFRAGTTCLTPATLCADSDGVVWSAGPGAKLLIAAPKP
ncbi:MAG: class I mannose-6-phosphate isomerase [Phycisphaerales bacterium]|nr:class I mannose-6-phosphate isomerase [Phycisphaerales bacterium]